FLHNEGTILSNVNGQWIDINEISSFVNDGLILGSDGGNVSIDYNDAFLDRWTNDAQGVIGEINGTLELGGRFTKFGLISAVNSTVDFGGGAQTFDNAGHVLTIGGVLSLETNNWTDSGLIATNGTAVYVEQNGTISAGGTLIALGGSVSGPGSLEDD